MHTPVGRATTWLVTMSCMAALAIAGASEAPRDELRDRAIELYDSGAYDAALPLLEQLDGSGHADGPLLYRLAFARARTGDAEGAAEAQRRALEALESEYAAPGSVETAFYLSNAYRNLGRTADSRRVAAETTARIEAGDLEVGDAPLDLFRVGKLYEDQTRHDEVRAWYGRAVEAMSADPGRYLGSLRWALRHLGNLAFARGDYRTSADRFARLTSLDGSVAGDWDALATARARLADWDGAVDAWAAAERADPIRGNRARYALRLARAAAEIGPLPDALPDGRRFAAMSKEDLESVMSEQAAVVDDVVSRVPEDGVREGDRRSELQDRLDRARPLFVAAALEYTMRNLPIRETAFFGGYAPLIFHGSRWRLPE